MCLAVPGKILETRDENGSRLGRVQFGGITRLVQLDFVPEANVGDYVIVHVGFALSKVDTEEAQRTYQLLEEMGLLEAEETQESGFGIQDSGSDTQDSGFRIQDSGSPGSGSSETRDLGARIQDPDSPGSGSS
jgi:hydrogenase expression/formation protein HypC